MERKTIVFTNRVYPPLPGATGELLRDLAVALASRDHRVLVLTSRGPGAETAREVREGVELRRVGVAPFTRSSHLRRAVSYFGVYPKFLRHLVGLGRVDAIVSMTDPPLQLCLTALAGGKAARRVHWAQDVYPELAGRLGVLRPGGLPERTLQALSTWGLRRHDRVVAVGRCMREVLLRRGLAPDRVEVLPNWTTVVPAPEAEIEAMRAGLGWGRDFVALYSGNLGLAHDFSELVAAARRLAEVVPRMRVVVAGEGPRKAELQKLAQGVSVEFLPPQPRKQLAAFLGAADVHLVSVRADLGGLVVPSKFYGVLAVGRPCIYLGPPGTEVARVISEEACGLAVANGEVEGVVDALQRMARDRDFYAGMAEAARRASAHGTLERAVDSFTRILGV